MEEAQRKTGDFMQGGTFLRLLFFISLLGLIAGLMLPILIEELLDVDAYKAQKRAEIVVEQAAKWYVINNGAPQIDLNTEQSKQVLIPDYLNEWPGQEPIECIIRADGRVEVYTRRDDKGIWIMEWMGKMLSRPQEE